jgi:spore germination protein KA
LIAVIFALIIPSTYVAIQLYHYKVVPLRLLLNIAKNTEKIPMSPFVEILFVVVLFEILHESGLRMPKFLGMSLSIVGGIIIGDMTVQAGLVSPPALIVVALSGLTIYTVPDFAPQLFVLRIGFILMGAVLGLLGIALSIYFLIAYMSNLGLFGSPYLAPLAPYIKSDFKDFIKRSHITDMELRPKSIKNINRKRLGK